jgi:hypothetical protein
MTGFNPALLTDDELVIKETELNRRIVMSAMYGSNMVEPLQKLLVMIEMERRDRFEREIFNMRLNNTPSVIETEKDINSPSEKTKQTTKTTSAPTKTVIRSDRPTSGKDDK